MMRELENDTDQTKEDPESVSCHGDADFDDFPPSLLRYFENSQTRAAVCEKLILMETEDFTAPHHNVGMMNCHIEVAKDTMTLNEQVICDSENEENNTFTDTRPLPAPTGTEALFTHGVSVCRNNEGKAGTNTYMESEKHLNSEMRTPEICVNEKDRSKSFEYEAEQDKQKSKEMNKEQKAQIERDFQRELKKIMDAEKRHQKEIELMEKRAQESLEQEFLLQQELISNLQRQVEEERRTWEEEQKRMKEEKDKRKRDKEGIKMEAERRRKKEEEIKNKEEEMKKMAWEEKKREEEERNKIDLEKKLEDEMRMKNDEEIRKKKKEAERGNREEERKKIEEAIMKLENLEDEKRKTEEQRPMKEDEWRKDERESKNMEKQNMGKEEDVPKEIKESKKQEPMREKKEDDKVDDQRKMATEKMHEEIGKGDKREQGKLDEEIKLMERKMKEENYRNKMEEEDEEEAKQREMERKKMETTDMKEIIKQEKEHRKIEELRSNEEDEKRKLENEIETLKEEERRLQKETRRQSDDRTSEEETRLQKDEYEYEGYDQDGGEMEQDSKTKDTENNRKDEKVSKNMDAEEEVGEKKVNVKMEDGVKLEEKEIKMRMVQNRGEEVRAIRANEVPKKREHSGAIGQTESVVQTEKSSHIEASTTCTSSSPCPLLSESTICACTNAARAQRYEESTCQNPTDKTVDCKNQAVRSSTASVCWPVCLPEHTEQRRLSWMKGCVSWSDLSLQNRRKHTVSAWSQRGPQRATEAGRLPALSPASVLQSTSWKSLQEVTSVTLEDLPGCSLSTLAQCPQLRSLSLRRCGLRSLEGIKQLQQLCYIDVQENDISFVDCENMPSLRVLHLAHNKLTSIHGFAGTENLDVLELSHNYITRIAGLESMRRLQRLTVDHNHLISTKGLRHLYTLLHLNCSNNHLASVEGLENNALLHTLDLRANSLIEPPSLSNQVLLRELYLDDNSISSLQGLAACWLPLLQHLSVAQNRILQLPPMSDTLSLSRLDLGFNCISELQNVCESLEGCQFLREIHLTENPLQQEKGWRSALQKAVPGLRAIDDQETDSCLSPPAVQQVSLAPGSFLMFCQAQLQETHDLLQRHRWELSNVSSSLDAIKTLCRHFTEALQLATDQRFAHEYGDTTVPDKHRTAGLRTAEEMLDVAHINSGMPAQCPEMESTGKASPYTPNSNNVGCSYRTFDQKPVVESWHDVFGVDPKTGPALSKARSGSIPSLTTKSITSSNLGMTRVSNHQDLDLKNTAAAVIQQWWRKYRQRCENISNPHTGEEGGGDGGKPESGPSSTNRRVLGQENAATVIQAFWRGAALRRRLTSALAAVTCLNTRADDTFEEVDINEFVFDEAGLENNWTLQLSEDSLPRYYAVSEEPLPLQPPGTFSEPSQYLLPPPHVWKSKQAWVGPEQVNSCVQRVSPVNSNRCSPPASASASVVSGLSKKSKKILEEWGFTHSHTTLLMLKRAQRMKSKKQHPKTHRGSDPSVHLASFRNQPDKAEAWNRQAQHNRNYIKVCDAELGPQQAEKMERLQTQYTHSDSESVHFLPEISSGILNGGRVQLVADPGYTERLHHASGLWANSSLAGQPSKESDYSHRNSLSHGREKAPSPKLATSAPTKRERISFRDNPVQLSGGWGGGKKRNNMYN